MIRRYFRVSGPAAAITVLLTGAETSLLYVLTAIIAGGPEKAPAPWLWLWGAGIVAFFLSRAIERVSRRWNRWVLIAAFVLAVTVPVSRFGYSVLLVVSLMVLWWRQATRGSDGFHSARVVFRSAPVPVALLCVFGILSWGVSSDDPALLDVLVRYVGAFFALCLLALLYGRWTDIQRRERRSLLSVAGWSVRSLLPLALTFGLASLVWLSVSGDAAPIFAFVLQLLVLPFLLVFGASLNALIWLTAESPFRGVMNMMAVARERIGDLIPGLSQATQSKGVGKSEAVQHAASHGKNYTDTVSQFSNEFWVILNVLILLVVLFAIVIYIRSKGRSRSDDDIARSSAWERPNLMGKLALLFGRLRGGMQGTDSDPLRAMLSDPTWRYTAEARKAYRDTEEVYRRAGHARNRSQTPHEHAESESYQPLSELASIYQQARYSTRPLSRQLAERARSLRKRIKSEMHG